MLYYVFKGIQLTAIGGIIVFGRLILTYIGMPSFLLLGLLYLILWIVGLALLAKEILSKHSY